MILPPPRSTLFPYTTLFRSSVISSSTCRPNFSARYPVRLWIAARLFVSWPRSEEHTSELQSLRHLVCRLLLEKKSTHGKLIRHVRSYDNRPSGVTPKV